MSKQPRPLHQLAYPEGVALDVQGNIYVADHGNNRLAKFSAAGKPLAQWTLPRPNSVAVDRLGNVYVLDDTSHIHKLSPRGQPLAEWQPGNTFDAYRSAGDLALDIGGNVYIVDRTARAVSRLSEDGHVVAQWPEPSPDDSHLGQLQALTIGKDGNMYVLRGRAVERLTISI